MGSTVVYKKLAQMLGHEVIEPSKPTQRTIDLGVKYSPEFACFPFKVILGSYIESINKGAEVIVTSGGFGPCRAGYYGEMHKKILQSLGYDIQMIIFDSFKKDPHTFIKNLKKFKGKASFVRLYKIFNKLYRMSKDLDFLEKKLQTKRAYEITKGQCSKVWNDIQNIYDRNFDPKKARLKGLELIDNIYVRDVKEEEKIRIGIVGEIYVVMESSVNMKIEEVLASLGCEVRRSHYLSQWIDANMMPRSKGRSKEETIRKKGMPYLEVRIGGHGLESIGHIIHYAEQGYDGIVQLMPFGCLPELVVQSIIPKVAKDYNIPILTIALDEQMGISNNLTRIEAFVDLIREGKRNNTMKIKALKQIAMG